MSHRGRHISLIALLWLMLSPMALAFAGAEKAAAPVPADEFCAPTRPTIRCPKTSAAMCACSMSGRSSQVEAQPAAAHEPTVTTVRVVRIKPVLRALPKTEWNMVCLTFEDSIPTPPPRQ